MSATHGRRLERHLIQTIRQEANSGAHTSVSTGAVVSKVGGELNVPAVEVRGAIWRLVDSQQLEFTEDWRLKLGSDHRAA